MADLPRVAARWRDLYRRWIASRRESTDAESQQLMAGTGSQAVAFLEALVADAWSVGGSWPATEEVSELTHHSSAGEVNLFGRVPSRLDGEGARGALAAAMGASVAGLRTSTFISGPDLSASVDFLREAVRRRLPLVVHLAARAGGGRNSFDGTSHDSIHLAADSGALLFHAVDVQEAVDLTLLAHRVAELALLPVVLAMDVAETAQSVQDFLFPDADALRRYLGDTNDMIDVPAPSQERLFGPRRLRLPRWHDSERPLLVAPGQEGPLPALAAAARQLLTDREASELVRAARAELEALTRRDCGSLRVHGIEGAKLLLVAEGAAVELLEATTDKLADEGQAKTGVVGIRCLRPFPGGGIVDVLARRRLVAVLERSDAPSSVDPPLLRSLRSVIERATERGESGENKKAVGPALAAKDIPRLISVSYGVGSLPVAASDVGALCLSLDERNESPLYLGLDFSPAGDRYPKQAAELGAVERAYPDLVSHGLPRHQPELDVRPSDAVSVGHLFPDAPLNLTGPVSAEAGDLLIRLLGGHLRSRSHCGAIDADGARLECFTHSRAPLRDPGADAPLDLLFWTVPEGTPEPAARRALSRLASGGVLLLESDEAEGGGPEALAPDLLALLTQRNAALLLAPIPAGCSADALREHRLGSLLAAISRRGWREVHPRKLGEARTAMMADNGVSAEHRAPLVEALSAGFEQVEDSDLSQLRKAEQEEGLIASASSVASPASAAPPLTAAETKTPLASLPRFWDQVGVLYQDGESERLTPQPMLTAPTVPPLSAALHLRASVPAQVPSFDPALCTGCGQCWTACPDGAIGPLVLAPSALIEGCMESAQGKGANVEALRMLVAKLGSGVASILASAEGPALDLPVLLSSAFDGVVSKTRLTEERKTALEIAFAKLHETLPTLPIVRTASFFEHPEKREKGSGEIFSLAIDADACKECGLCVAECEPEALRTRGDKERLTISEREDLAGRWALCSSLPAPSENTLQKASRNPDLSPLSAVMLNRKARAAMAGADLGEPGAGDKIAVRQIVTTALSRLEPVSRKTLEDVHELQARLGDEIHGQLALAIPADDLSALGRGLAALARPESDLKGLLGRVESAIEDTQVDVVRLKRLVASAAELADFAWRLEKGEGGWGRQPLGLVVGPGRASSWIGPFPFNPFSLPVTLESNGNPAELAAGIASGLEHQSVALARAMRRARTELERPSEAVAGEAQLKKLTWSKLTAEERTACPSLLVLLSESEIASSGFSGLLDLLSSNHGVKIVLLSDLELVDGATPRKTGPWASGGARLSADPGLLALSQTSGYVAQTSIAHPEHLTATVGGAFDVAGPALLRVYAPSPSGHGFSTDQTLERARRAVDTRAFPLYSSPPPSEPGGLRPLDLEGNPGTGNDWYHGMTPADWARQEARFSSLFKGNLGDDAEPLSSYLRMPRSERQGRQAYLETNEEEGGKIFIDQRLVAAIDCASAVWRSLNAWSQVERYLEESESRNAERLANAELRRQHHDELAALEREHQSRLATLHAEIEADLAKRLRGRLVELALRSSQRPSVDPGS